MGRRSLALFTLALILATAVPAQADTGTLQALKPTQSLTTTVWSLGNINNPYPGKPIDLHPGMGVLTYTFAPYGATFAKYSLFSVLFYDGGLQQRRDISHIWEVAQAEPALYLVVAWSGVYTKSGALNVFGIDTAHDTLITLLREPIGISDAKLQCGIVFSASGKRYTLRAIPWSVQAELGHNNLTHSLIPGVNLCA